MLKPVVHLSLFDVYFLNIDDLNVFITDDQAAIKLYALVVSSSTFLWRTCFAFACKCNMYR